jgi:hypothetical protein
MPILMIAEQPNLHRETYTSMIDHLMPLLRSAKGFLSHAGGPSTAGGIRIVEIWESEADFRRFFDDHLKPNIPPGLAPNLISYELHTAFVRAAFHFSVVRLASGSAKQSARAVKNSFSPQNVSQRRLPS